MPEAVIIKRMILILQKQGQNQEAYCIKAKPDTVGFMGVQCPRKPVFFSLKSDLISCCPAGSKRKSLIASRQSLLQSDCEGSMPETSRQYSHFNDFLYNKKNIHSVKYQNDHESHTVEG